MVATHLALLLALWARALAAWGAPDMPIQFFDGAGGISLAAASAQTDGSCIVTVYPGFWAIDPAIAGAQGFPPIELPSLEEAQARVIEHELGHCLGFDHPDPPDPGSIMSDWRLGVTDHDRALYAHRLAWFAWRRAYRRWR